MKRLLVQLLVQGKTVHMFVAHPGETPAEITERVRESIALTMMEFDDSDGMPGFTSDKLEDEVK